MRPHITTTSVRVWAYKIRLIIRLRAGRNPLGPVALPAVGGSGLGQQEDRSSSESECPEPVEPPLPVGRRAWMPGFRPEVPRPWPSDSPPARGRVRHTHKESPPPAARGPCRRRGSARTQYNATGADGVGKIEPRVQRTAWLRCLSDIDARHPWRQPPGDSRSHRASLARRG